MTPAIKFIDINLIMNLTIYHYSMLKTFKPKKIRPHYVIGFLIFGGDGGS